MDSLSNRIISLFTVVGDWAAFTVLATLAMVNSTVRVSTWLRPLYRFLVGGLPLAVVLGIALGVVIWLHTRGVLAKTAGAVELLPTFLAAAVLLELAPLGAGLIIASRSGASLGAELASLKLGEQIDALQLLGASPWQMLVGPRVWATVLTVPVLNVLIAAVAIGSGYLAEWAVAETSWLKYQQAVLAELYLGEVIPAGLKTLVFGWLIGVTGCFYGLRAEGGSEGVGQAATNSVVACTLLVLLADVFLVGLIQYCLQL